MNKVDPKWGDIIDTIEFVQVFNIKSGFGPYVNGKPEWNRCWSCIPRLWEQPVRNFINKIIAVYTLESATDTDCDRQYDVIVDQIKDKYGTLRVYFTADQPITDQIYTWIAECEEEIKLIDPFYGVPW